MLTRSYEIYRRTWYSLCRPVPFNSIISRGKSRLTIPSSSINSNICSRTTLSLSTKLQNLQELLPYHLVMKLNPSQPDRLRHNPHMLQLQRLIMTIPFCSVRIQSYRLSVLMGHSILLIVRQLLELSHTMSSAQYHPHQWPAPHQATKFYFPLFGLSTTLSWAKFEANLSHFRMFSTWLGIV